MIRHTILAASAVFLLSVGAVAQTATSAIDIAKWSEGNANKRLALEYLQMVNQGRRAEAVRTYASPEFVNHRSPMPAAAQREANRATAPVAPAAPGAELKAILGQVIADGELVVIHYIVTSGDDIGRPITNAFGRAGGAKVGTNVVDIFRIENGKIVEKWDAIESIDRIELFGS